MDREKFIEEFKKEEISTDVSWEIEIIKRSIKSNLFDGNPRGHKNLIIVMEELAELSKEIAKYLRLKGDTVCILEEMADVQCGIYYLQDICNIDNKDLQRAIQVKLKRLERVLNEKGSYQ